MKIALIFGVIFFKIKQTLAQEFGPCEPPLDHPLNLDCVFFRPYFSFVNNCVENAVKQGARQPNCICKMGYYFMDKDVKGGARCEKCHEMCSIYCTGPPSIVEKDGAIEYIHNEACVFQRKPQTIIGQDENYLLVLGHGCYMYSFGDLYFVLSSPIWMWTIRQDYQLDNYAFVEKSFANRHSPPVEQFSFDQLTNCRALYQDTFFISGILLKTYSNIQGPNTVSLNRYMKKTDYYAYNFETDQFFGEFNKENFSLLALIKTSGQVIIASPNLKNLLVMRTGIDPYEFPFVELYKDTEAFPAKLVELSEPYILVLWQETNYRSIAKVTYTKIDQFDYQKASNVIGRDINADFNKMPFTPESDPRVAVLFGQNKIEILRSSNLEQQNVFTINQWKDVETSYQVLGTILFVPYSSKVVAAIEGERKVVFIDYLNDSLESRSEFPTAFDSISQIMIPDRHKMMVLFERKLDLVVTYIISDLIGCPPSEHVKKCSPLLLFEEVECLDGFQWNPVLKKCQCLGGSFYNESSKTCEKCKCPLFSKCHKSDTDCHDEPYLTYYFTANNTSVDSLCLTKDIEQKLQLLIADGQYISMFDVNIKDPKKPALLVRQSIMPYQFSESGKTKMSCQQNIFFISSKFINSILTLGVAFNQEEDRFLNPTVGLNDVIYTRKQFYPWMIFAGSSTPYDDSLGPSIVQVMDNEDTATWDWLYFLMDHFYHQRNHVQIYQVGEPISSMTSYYVWNEPQNLRRVSTERSILQDDYLVCAPISRTSTTLKIFKTITMGMVIREESFYRPPDLTLPKLKDQVYKRMLLLKKSEMSQVLFAITEDKLIIRLDFVPYKESSENLPSPMSFAIRSLPRLEEIIRETEYIDLTTFFVGCSNFGSCVVVNFETENYPEKVIYVGLGYSQIHLMKAEKLMAVSYPGSSSVSFFFLEEARCIKFTNGDCYGLNTEIAISCHPGQHVHPRTKQCVCLHLFYFDIDDMICRPCHSACRFSCHGPLEDDCSKKWYYDSEERMQYNFVCYDDPVEWYNPLTDNCEWFEGFKASDQHCLDCPKSLANCLSCDSTASFCNVCRSGYIKVDGQCNLDCGDINSNEPQCEDSLQFEQIEQKFDANVRDLTLKIKVNSLDPQKLVWMVAKQFMNLDYPDGNLEQREAWKRNNRIAGFEGEYSLLFTEWDFSQVFEFSYNFTTAEKKSEEKVITPTNIQSNPQDLINDGIDLDRNKWNMHVQFANSFRLDNDSYVFLRFRKSSDGQFRNILRDKTVYQKELYIKRKTLSWKVSGGRSAETRLIPFVEVPLKGQKPGNEQVLFESKKLDIPISVLTGVAVVIKYFVIFDIVTNFVSKVNVKLTPYLEEHIYDIKKLEFPSLPFLQSVGKLMTNDGGETQDEEYFDRVERERRIQEDIFQSTDTAQTANNASSQIHRDRAQSILSKHFNVDVLNSRRYKRSWQGKLDYRNQEKSRSGQLV